RVSVRGGAVDTGATAGADAGTVGGAAVGGTASYLRVGSSCGRPEVGIDIVGSCLARDVGTRVRVTSQHTVATGCPFGTGWSRFTRSRRAGTTRPHDGPGAVPACDVLSSACDPLHA